MSIPQSVCEKSGLSTAFDIDRMRRSPLERRTLTVRVIVDPFAPAGKSWFATAVQSADTMRSAADEPELHGSDLAANIP